MPLRTLRPWMVVLLAHLVYIGVVLARHQGDPLSLARIGHGPNEGYDGQFTYLLAIDPSPTAFAEAVEVRADVAPYRYQRILLPALARFLGLGQPGLIAWTIPLVNLTAQVVGTSLVEALLVNLNVGRWHALVYGLWPGLAVAVRADLTEPLSYGLAAAAYLADRRDRIWLAAMLFGLSLLAKETSIVFVAAQLAYAGFTRDARRALSLAAVAVVPFGLWQAALWATFGSPGLGSGGYLGTSFELVPFMGAWRIAPVSLAAFAVLILYLGPWVMLPAVWGIAAAARELWRRNWHPYVWALGANAAIIPFTPFSTFREPVAMLRFCTGLVLATLLFGGLLRARRVLNYSWFWLAMLVFLVKD